MSNRAALILGLLIVAAVLADQMLNAGAGTLFAARRMVGLIETVAFWR